MGQPIAHGEPMARAGDINGDGFDDIIVGAPRADANGTDSGAAYLLFGFPPTINVNDASILETNDGVSTITFDVLLSGAFDQEVSVTVSSADATAHAGEDYDALLPTRITFAPGETLKHVALAIHGDSTFEPDETFTLQLTAPAGLGIFDGTATGTVRNDDARPTVSINDVSLGEPATAEGIATLTVTLSNPSVETVTVLAATENGSAVAPDDYTPFSGTLLTFAPGETSKTVEIHVQPDAIHELDESLGVRLTGETNASLGDSVGEVTILNLQPLPVLSVTGIEVTEGDATNIPGTLTVRLSGPSSQAVTVAYALMDGSAIAGTDYIAQETGTLLFAPGELVQTLTVTTIGNTRDDIDQRAFSLALSAPAGATLPIASADIVIVDNDPLPSFSIQSASAVEGNTAPASATFTVTLSAPSGRMTSVNYATSSGAAIEGLDFTASTGVLEFNPGETSKTFSVEVKGDTLTEQDETFGVTLSAPLNATIAGGTALGTIFDNDLVAALSIDDAQGVEGTDGNAVVTFNISLSSALERAVTVSVSTADGSANSGEDYDALIETQLTFAPGEISKQIAVPIHADPIYERDETFTVSLSNPNGAVVLDRTALGTITNDDPLPAISIIGGDLNEPATSQGTATFILTLANPASEPVSVIATTED
ncbi:MAG TPA: Calx-beta domain-containing protein, partial [Chthoniobacteraceae bacterium]|nr:Calx-beta domain-containing protein [Chthoniobacteraceae bacterium]